jgi:hypothetical protein
MEENMPEKNTSPHVRNATIVRFPVLPRGQSEQQPVALAQAIELCSKTFPSRSALLTLLQSWLFIADRDGVSVRQPEYAAALRRAITAFSTADSVPEAIAIIRLQEATLARLSSVRGGADER